MSTRLARVTRPNNVLLSLSTTGTLRTLRLRIVRTESCNLLQILYKYLVALYL